MTLLPVLLLKKRKLNLFLLLIMLLACFAALTFDTTQSLQANQNEENALTKEEPSAKSTLLDVIKENQTKLDYIPFDFFFGARDCFVPKTAAPYLYPKYLLQQYRYALTYERFRLVNALIDAALNASPDEFCDALDASEQLSVKGQALLMLALYKYESVYCSSLFDAQTGERIQEVVKRNGQKELTEENWNRYENLLKENLKSKEIVYEPLVRNDDDRKKIIVQWHNSMRWNYANMILLYPNRRNESPLEAYALKAALEMDILHLRVRLGSLALIPEQFLAREQKTYSNLGQPPKDLPPAPLDIDENTASLADNQEGSDQLEANQSVSWRYNASMVKTITSQEALKEYGYIPKYLKYINDLMIQNIMIGGVRNQDDFTCEQQVTLGDVAKLLLNARTRFQSREDFERMIASSLQDTE